MWKSRYGLTDLTIQSHLKQIRREISKAQNSYSIQVALSRVKSLIQNPSRTGILK